jgi:cytochrome b561
MRIKNTHEHFGIVAITFHWVMALLLIGLVALGLYMTSLPNNLLKLKLYGWHKEFGSLVLILAMLRVMWRLHNILPSYATLTAFEHYASQIAHWLFYGFMFALPITGWIITSAAGLPISFFGLFLIPTLITPNLETMELFETIHEWLAYGLIATFCLHVLAALKHHFINKDDILKRMLK